MGKVVELRRFLTTFPQFDQGPSLMNWRGSWTTYRRVVELSTAGANPESLIHTRELVELIVLGSTSSAIHWSTLKCLLVFPEGPTLLFTNQLLWCAASTGPTLSYAGSVLTLKARPDFLQYPALDRLMLPTPLAYFSVIEKTIVFLKICNLHFVQSHSFLQIVKNY